MTEAILLVGGQGTRLRPLTIHAPKPMLPVAGVPCTEHQIARAREAGVTRVVLGTSYRAEVFEEYFGDGARFGVELIYAVEDHPMGTGGAIRNAAAHLHSDPGDPVLVFNGDVLTGVDLGNLMAVHARTAAAVTLYLTRVADPRRLRPGAHRRRRAGDRVPEKPSTPEEIVTDQINAGCYVFRREVIDRIPAGRPCRWSARPSPACCRPGSACRASSTRVLAGPRHPVGLRAGLRGPRSRVGTLARRCPGPRARPRAPRGRGRSEPCSSGGTVVGAGATVGAGRR